MDAAQARVGGMLSAHGSVAIGVARNHLRVGVWTLETAQARALAKALYQRQVAVLRIDRGIQPDELRALVLWLAGPVGPPRARVAGQRGPYPAGARHLHLQPLDYSAVRLTDHSDGGPGGHPPRPSSRSATVSSTWSSSGAAPGDADRDWSSDEPATGSAVPAEVAMVGLAEELPEGTGRTRASGAGRR